MNTLHVHPVDDLVQHRTDGHPCVCGPATQAVFLQDGTNHWLVTHHSLDGREQRETNRSIPPGEIG